MANSSHVYFSMVTRKGNHINPDNIVTVSIYSGEDALYIERLDMNAIVDFGSLKQEDRIDPILDGLVNQIDTVVEETKLRMTMEKSNDSN